MYAIPVYILVLFLTIIIDYIAGIMIEQAKGQRRKWFLVMSIVTNVGVLAFFKYYNFFATNINELLHVSNANANVPLLNILLPIGLSFHTFQAMSYTIEVYRGNHKAERHFGIYALYVMFYPQLVAGPIERPQNILHQFYEHHKLEYNNVAVGIRLMLWGMIKKVVVADRLAKVTDSIFNVPHQYSGITLAIGAVFFAFQIFCDFSGYSDIALGAARVMGFRLLVNFNHPYSATSISDFWRRWHISLSTWFRDYVYIPLGGNRRTKPRNYFNLFFIFLLSGFWHGANWTFIIWGALHGFYMIFATLTAKRREKMANAVGLTQMHTFNKLLNQFSTFLLVTLAWVFFRANNVKDAAFIISKIANIPKELLMVAHTKKIAFLNLPGIIPVLLPCIIAIIFLQLAYFVQIKLRLEHTFYKKPILVRWAVYYTALFILFYFGVFDQHRFIYFQF
jgi:D-alanyl-lipoteichoic acid acyltransferase DltB (MBOAT superfamily)